MITKTKTDEQIKDELGAVERHLIALFNVQIDPELVQEIISQLIHDKVTDYMVNRWQDWDPRSLIQLLTLAKQNPKESKPIEQPKAKQTSKKKAQGPTPH